LIGGISFGGIEEVDERGTLVISIGLEFIEISFESTLSIAFRLFSKISLTA
jgi:hypothetical protein